MKSKILNSGNIQETIYFELPYLPTTQNKRNIVMFMFS
jgi:hypothetical protein